MQYRNSSLSQKCNKRRIGRWRDPFKVWMMNCFQSPGPSTPNVQWVLTTFFFQPRSPLSQTAWCGWNSGPPTLRVYMDLSLSLFGINGREREQVMIDDQTGHHFSTDPVSMIAKEFYYLCSSSKHPNYEEQSLVCTYLSPTYGWCKLWKLCNGGWGRKIRIIGYDSIKRYQLIALRHGAHTWIFSTILKWRNIHWIYVLCNNNKHYCHNSALTKRL